MDKLQALTKETLPESRLAPRTPEQNHKPLSILAEIDAVARSPVNPVVRNTISGFIDDLFPEPTVQDHHDFKWRPEHQAY